MSKSKENENIVNSAIDAEQQVEQQQPNTTTTKEKTVTIPVDQYDALMQSNLNSHLFTLDNLDDWDKMIATMANCQIFAMNIKEKIKKKQLPSLNKPENQQTDKTNA